MGDLDKATLDFQEDPEECVEQLQSEIKEMKDKLEDFSERLASLEKLMFRHCPLLRNNENTHT